jgi:hydroxymethylglutaryl-CoA lyase
VEVGPRDGFQSVTEWIPTEVKLQIIDELVRSNLKTIQVTSFVHPAAVPQMRDAAQVARTVLARYPNVRFSALVPNVRGAMAARESGIRFLAYVVSASEAHNAANVNRTIEQSLAELGRLRQMIPEAEVELDIATAFGCPFQGTIPQPDVMRIVERAYELGIRRMCLCDTIGTARPAEVGAMVAAIPPRYPDVVLHLHLHNARGRGLGSSLAGIRAGAVGIETSIGGLGGCPFAPGAAGNVATERAVAMLESMGIATAVNRSRLKPAAAAMRRAIEAITTVNCAHSRRRTRGPSLRRREGNRRKRLP